MNGKQVIAQLKQDGWTLIRITGSHHIMRKEGVLRDVPVPVHGSKELGIGIIKAIEKQSGVKLR